jgi:hypothetical protein
MRFFFSFAAALALVACKKSTADEVKVDASEAPRSSAAVPVVPSAAVASSAISFPAVPIRASGTTTVRIAWKSPEGTGVNDDAPFRVRWNRSDALAEAPADVKATGNAARDGFSVVVTPLPGAPNATLAGVIDLVVCDVANHSVCKPVRRNVAMEFVVDKAAAPTTSVTVPLPQAR